MWFKNLQLYRLTTPFTLTAAQLNEQLAKAIFRPCGALDMFGYGWVSPLGHPEGELVHAGNGYFMLCAQREDKVLPATVIRDVVKIKAAAIEEEEGRPVRGKRRTELKEAVIQELLPRAFTYTTLTYAYLAPREGWLIVDTANLRKADQLTSYLRRTLGELTLTAPKVNTAPGAVMTGWLRGDDIPADLTIDDECELQDKKEGGGSARFKRQDLTGDEVGVHLQSGKQVVRLAVTWDERLSVILGDDLSIKRLKFGDLIQEQRQDIQAEDANAEFDADFAIMTLELSRFLPRLLEWFGGEEQPIDVSKPLQAAA
jgi:recombination associated protein RdgC